MAKSGLGFIKCFYRYIIPRLNMKKYDVMLCELFRREELAEGMFSFVLCAPEIARTAAPGQFVHVRLPHRTLRRPISLCEINPQEGTVRLVFQIRGEGTAELAEIREGQDLDVLGPLGTGFPLRDKGEKALLVGGGIGVPPLLPLAQHYGANATVALGFRNSGAVILESDFRETGASVVVATDDGSHGENGIVTQMIPEQDYDVIYTCGPAPMLRAVAGLAARRGIRCYISLEERMACGVGACLGCACELLDESGKSYFGHVCKDGPVFDYRRVREYAATGGKQGEENG